VEKNNATRAIYNQSLRKKYNGLSANYLHISEGECEVQLFEQAKQSRSSDEIEIAWLYSIKGKVTILIKEVVSLPSVLHSMLFQALNQGEHSRVGSDKNSSLMHESSAPLH
jgi:transcriptional regulator of aromatic amino acid metabolism